MKHTMGIYFMLAGMLMGMYMLFGVYLPMQLPVRAEPFDSSMVSLSNHELARDKLVGGRTVITPVLNEPILRQAPTTAGRQDERDEMLLAKYERPKKKAGLPTSMFSIPIGLKTEVEFWKNVYTKYDIDQAVLHDPDDLGKIYGVIKLSHCDDPPRKECLKVREDEVQAAKDILMINLPEDTKIRAQTGQKDKFVAGIESSKKYLPNIEKIFDGYGVPKEISRLAFVESMFNMKAYSRSGAAGIWQLMPSTARVLGLKVGKKLDERYDSAKSTDAAARHLMRDYKRLGSWQLALNAYNAGPGRLADATNQLGTKDIVKIIKNYSHPAYGFAARNFYPCFLAILECYENRDDYFKEELNAKK